MSVPYECCVFSGSFLCIGLVAGSIPGGVIGIFY